jgi:hypothetical protein
MARAIAQSRPVAHVPVVLGVGRKLQVAARIETCCPPHPAHGLSGGRGVEALLRAMLDGPQALYQGGVRVEARGRLPWRQADLRRAALSAHRLGQRLEARFAAPLHRVCGAIALTALEVSALSPPGLPQEPPPRTLSGASEAETPPGNGPGPPRPASGHRKDGREDLQPVLLRLGVRRAGLPRRMGVRAGKTRDRPEPPGAMEADIALGLDGGRGIGADRKADGQRTLGGAWSRAWG